MLKITDTEKLGALIRSTRKAQRLTQEQLAGICGVGVRFIRELEHGKDSCHIGKALSVLQMLGLTLSVDAPDLDAFSGDGSGKGAGAGSGWG